MAYPKQEWNYKKPITPEALNHMEDGIANSIDLDSNQTIEGTKTFEQPVVVNGAPTENNHAVRWEDIKINYIDNQEVPTNEYLNGKRVYAKRIVFMETVSAAKVNSIPHNISNYDEIWIDAGNSYISARDEASVPITANYYLTTTTELISATISHDNILIIATGGWNQRWKKVVTVKYTKK